VTAEHVAALRAIRDEPSVKRWWGELEDDFPLGDEPGTMRFAIVVDGEIAGMVQAGEENERDYRSAWVDIFVATRFQNRGVGTEAVKQTVRFLIEQRGHHRITIDPAVENAAAIRCYEKAGFERVGVMRMASRVPGTSDWHDDLLMELVVEIS
jgi:aminoglycoside 6'-N-acetyltransferase